MQIRVKWDVSKDNGVHNITLEDIGCTIKEWRKMTDGEKESEIQKVLDGLPEQPYMQLSYYEEY